MSKRYAVTLPEVHDIENPIEKIDLALELGGAVRIRPRQGLTTFAVHSNGPLEEFGLVDGIRRLLKQIHPQADVLQIF